MTHIDTHIAFLTAVAAVDRLGVVGPADRWDDAKWLMRQADKERRAGKHDAACKIFASVLDI